MIILPREMPSLDLLIESLVLVIIFLAFLITIAVLLQLLVNLTRDRQMED